MIKIFPIRQRLGWLLASLVVGIACCWTISVLLREHSKEIEGLLSDTQSEAEIDSNIPQPKLSPSEVVKLQVNSMRDAVEDITKLRVCYSLASPENRKNTGPFLRFAELVKASPYDRLANCKGWQLGDTIINKNFAAVLVSTTSIDGESSAFRFILRRQDFPRPDCWLTEAVQFIEEEPVRLRRNAEKELDGKVE